MMRGRKPLPNELHELHGNPGKRRRDKGSRGQPSTGRVPPQLKGNKEAVRCWKRLSKLLLGMGILTTADEDALALVCEAWADYRRACAGIEEMRELGGEVLPVFEEDAEGKLVPVPGAQRVNSWVAIRNAAWARFVKLLPEFGLTPSSRARVKGAPPETADPFEALLNGTGTAN